MSPRSGTTKPLNINLFAVAGAKVRTCFLRSLQPILAALSLLGQLYTLLGSSRILVRCPCMRTLTRARQSRQPPAGPQSPSWGWSGGCFPALGFESGEIQRGDVRYRYMLA